MTACSHTPIFLTLPKLTRSFKDCMQPYAHFPDIANAHTLVKDSNLMLVVLNISSCPANFRNKMCCQLGSLNLLPFSDATPGLLLQLQRLLSARAASNHSSRPSSSKERNSSSSSLPCLEARRGWCRWPPHGQLHQSRLCHILHR